MHLLQLMDPYPTKGDFYYVKMWKTKYHSLIRIVNDSPFKGPVYWQLSSSPIVDEADPAQWNEVTVYNLNSIMSLSMGASGLLKFLTLTSLKCQKIEMYCYIKNRGINYGTVWEDNYKSKPWLARTTWKWCAMMRFPKSRKSMPQ